jgi:hypothetical protein
MYSHDAHYRARILLLQSRNRTDKHEFVGKPLLSISVLSTCICRTPETNRYDRPGSLVSDKLEYLFNTIDGMDDIQSRE